MVVKRLAHNRKTPEEFYKELEAKHGDRYTVISKYIGANKPLLIRCNKCGYEVERFPHNVLNQGCKNCSILKRRVDKVKFIEKIKEVHGDEIEYISGYEDTRSRIELKCNICGNIWETQAGSVIYGKHGCRRCANSKTTPEEYKIKIKELYGDKFEILTPFISLEKKIQVKCNDCGNISYRFAKEVLKGRCKSCNNKAQKKPLEQFIEDIKRIHKGKISYLNGYNETRSRVNMICNICGHTWSTLANHIINGKKTGCAKCASRETANKNRKTHKQFVEDIYSIHREDIEVIGTYKNMKSKVGIRCNCCNHEWEAMPSDLQKGTGCPICKKSKGEKYILNLLNDNDIDFIPQYWFNDCRNIKPLPFDFAIFKDDKLLFLIEYQGEQHFRMVNFMGGEKGFNQRIERDQIKRDYCKSNNILLLEIPYTMSDLEIRETILSIYGGM